MHFMHICNSGSAAALSGPVSGHHLRPGPHHLRPGRAVLALGLLAPTAIAATNRAVPGPAEATPRAPPASGCRSANGLAAACGVSTGILAVFTNAGAGVAAGAAAQAGGGTVNAGRACAADCAPA